MGPPTGQNLNKLSHNRSAPKWSFRTRTFGTTAADEARRENPGPGAYSINSDHVGHKKSASYGFGSSGTGRGKQGGYVRPSSAPGPGQYRHESMGFATKSASPNYGFGSSHRDQGVTAVGFNKEILGSPGPGAYGTTSNITRKSQPNYTATPRRPQSAGGGYSTPGPGAYQSSNAKGDMPEPPRWKFGTSPRKHADDSATPGPGNYNSRTFIGGGTKYSMRAKHSHHDEASDVPGPGAVGGQWTQFE